MNAPMKATPDQLTQADWGHNWNGWEFLIENNTPFDIIPSYTKYSNIAKATDPIKAGDPGYAKGKKSANPFFTGPADSDLGFQFGSAVARVFIRGYDDGTTKRWTEQDNDRRLVVDFPEQARDVPQRVVFTWTEPWGPNYDGWVWELTNNSGHELIYENIPPNNVLSAPARLANGETAMLKGMRRAHGGPENCNFTYRRLDRPADFGSVAIESSSSADYVEVRGSKNGSIDIDYVDNPAANALQTVRYKPQG
ncbi:hypothetical protein ACTXG7_25820 [Mycolicibacterium sp. Dal123E01]|uniref:hypothetical protein n=1 Tax=Mycolicibacterium sp. Dal123E01 TaxID=3457578 RepID=UPI00403E4A10